MSLHNIPLANATPPNPHPYPRSLPLPKYNPNLCPYHSPVRT